MKLLQLFQKNLIWSIPLFMALGLIYGSQFDAAWLKSAILPFTFLMVYPMMVNLNIKKVFSKGDAKLQLVTQAINFLMIPFLGLLLGKLFFSDSPLVILGLLLTALLPTSGMTISWTGFAKGNMPAAVKMTVFGLVLGSLLTPVYLQLLLGANIEIPLLKVFTQIMIVVFVPMGLGFATQQLLIKKYGMARYQKDLKPKFPPISTLGVLSIVFIAMALKAKTVLADPAMLLTYLLPLALMYGVNFLVSTLIGKYLFSRKDGIALVYGSVMRNLSIALAIAMTVFGKDGSQIALIIALAYIIQVQSGAWYVKFTDKIFGPAPPDVAGDIMHRGVFRINRASSLDDAIDLFEKEHIHSLVVIDEQGEAVGILNTRTVFDHVASVNSDIAQPISSVTLKPMLVFDESASLKDIAREMKASQTYKVLIQDAQKNAVGVITETMFFNKLLHFV